MAKWYFLALFCTVVAFVELLCPFTKVEESFGMQAMHDFLYCRTTACFDHAAFPGVVPRSFLAPWITSIMALFPFAIIDSLAPWAFVQQTLIENPMILSHVCRMSLGLVVCASLWYVSLGLTPTQSSSDKEKNKKKRQGECDKANWKCQASSVFFLLALSQFHLIYYATRPLPNTYGLILTTLACGCALRRRYYATVALLSAASALFRCDILVLLASFGVFLLLRGDLTLMRGVCVGLSAVAVSLCFSVFIDSFLWGRWLWPESVVLFFNTAENQSWKWGRQPVHWYMTYALPRAFLFVYPLLIILFCLAWWPGATARLPVVGTESNVLTIRRLTSLWAAVAKRHVALLIPSSLFIALYSALPHKELRFIMVVFPWFLVPAAEAIAETWNMLLMPTVAKEKKMSEKVMRSDTTKPQKDTFRIFLLCIIVSICALQLTTVGVSVFLSMHNYPGARALERLHKIIEDDKHNTSSCIAKHERPVTVFIDAYAAMTGINRFQKQHNELFSTMDVHGAWNVVRGVPNAPVRRLVALLAFPFLTFQRMLQSKDSEISHMEAYDFIEPFGPEIFIANDSIGRRAPSSSSVPLSNLGESKIMLQYTKDPNHFDEASDLYRSEGIDYLLVRYSQLEMHRKHNDFEEVFIEYLPDWRATVKSLMHFFSSMTKAVPKEAFKEVITYREPFLLALRRRRC